MLLFCTPHINAVFSTTPFTKELSVCVCVCVQPQHFQLVQFLSFVSPQNITISFLTTLLYLTNYTKSIQNPKNFNNIFHILTYIQF